MNLRRFLHSDTAVAIGAALEAAGILFTLGTAIPTIGPPVAATGILLLTATLTTGSDHA